MASLHWRAMGIATNVVLGTRPVRRIGFGAMQLPGPGVFGPPRDHDTAIAILRRAVDLGVNHIDTAEYYGPSVANELIREALSPYPEELVLVSKVGARRDDKGGWQAAGSPSELRSGVESNLRTLGLEQVPIVNLRIHAPGAPDAMFDDQVHAMVRMRDDGLIGGIGVSNVSADQFLRALELTHIVTVQNLLNIVDQSARPVLDACRERNIPFVPFFPTGSAFGNENRVLASPVVRDVAASIDATPAQVALAWALAQAPNVLLIPGTSSLAHLEENMAVADIHLDDAAMNMLAVAELAGGH